MKTVSKVAHLLAWLFGALQVAVLLSTCVSGFDDTRLGLIVVGQVAFFGFLYLSVLADQSGVAVPTRVRHG